MKESDYGEEIEKAAENHSLPEVYCTDYSANRLPKGADLNRLIHSLKRRSFLFQSEYGRNYPNRECLPLSFETLVVYASYTQNEEELPEEYEIDDLMNQRRPEIYITDEEEAKVLCLADDSWILQKDLKESAVYQKNRNRVEALQMVMRKKNLEGALSLLSQQQIRGLAAGSRVLAEVDEAAKGTYAIVPLSRDGKILTYLRDNYSVSSQSEEKDQVAGMLFLGFLLSEYAQNKLHIESGEYFPISSMVLKDYIRSAPGLDFVWEKLQDPIVVGEGGVMVELASEQEP